MGLLSKLRHDRNQPLTAQPYQGHQRTYTSESSGTSEFSLNALCSSYSSQDTHRHSPKARPMRLSAPAGPQYSAQYQQFQAYQQQQQQKQLHPQLQQRALPQRKPPQPLKPVQPAYQPPVQHQVQPKYQQVQPQQKQPWPRPQHHRMSMFPQPLPLAEVTDSDESESESQSETESLSEEESGSEEDTSEESIQQRHPYYQQWKQYYAAVASYQLLMTQKPPLSNRHSMYPGMAPAAPAAPMPPASAFYQTQGASDNSLVRNSRRSTMKSTRSSSVPLLAIQEQVTPQNRAVSVNVATAEKIQNDSFEEEEDMTFTAPEEELQAKPLLGLSSKFKLMNFGLLEIAQGEDESGQISDYDAFLMEDDESEGEEPAETQPVQYQPAETQPVQIQPAEIQPVQFQPAEQPVQFQPVQIQTAEVQPVQYQPVQFQPAEIQPNQIQPTQIQPQTHPVEVAQTQAPLGLQTDLSPPPPIASLESPHDLDRQGSTASTTSYNSLQSEKELIVRGPSASEQKRKKSSRKSSRRSRNGSKLSKSKKIVPPMPGPPPPLLNMQPPAGFMPSPAEMKRQSTGSMPMDPAYLQQVQQQIQQLQQLQQLQMQFPVHQSPAYGSPPPAAGPRSSDSTINQKIEEFTQLRAVIASGNKSFDYRLKWMKMLMVATNYKLYAYINIKGEAVPSDQVSANKQFFIKSSVTHLQKLLKELDGSRTTGYEKTFAEVCYLQGCLLMNDFIERYNQDFGIECNNEEAEAYFQRSLELHPGFFKSHYKLGELYEREQTEEKFDLAFTHYMESAKMGYNRSIYKIAQILLMVPKERLTKFFKYFKSLADIDMTSKDIQLSGTDMEELKEVVGSALYQLGRIYEGIYPGDLSETDEFITQSLELAPVNYAKSLTYYNRSAKLQCLEAQVRLGRVYEFGDLNRKPNANKSIQWYIKASTSPLKFKRHPEAMMGISRWFTKGSDNTNKHIPVPDAASAVQWCQRACKEFSHPEAFYQMGLYAEEGIAPGNPKEWYAEAYRLGHVAAGARLST